MRQELSYPFDSRSILRRYRSLRRELLEQPPALDLRIAILGGSTTQELATLLELLLLARGIRPIFYQSEYNRFFEEAVLDTSRLEDFSPQLVYLHTSTVNILHRPALGASAQEFEMARNAELERFRQVWASIQQRFNCQIVQNNFEPPPVRVSGNLDQSQFGGLTHLVNQLNVALAAEARSNRGLLIHDLHSLSARVGLDQWFDWERWFSYKILTTPDASGELANSLANLIAAIYGKSHKCLVLDLDNTLWGGVIGDDGPERIRIGRETPQSEAFTAFQEYCLALRNRGIVLAVCSKNNEEIAKLGLEHPDSVLRLEHFAAFKANWSPKHENIEAIAQELNLGLDSLVFVDDNPAEREIVRAQLPMVTVPEVGSQVAQFSRILDRAGYFEPATLSSDDLQRANQYALNQQRTNLLSRFENYGQYLDALEMTAEISPFKPEYLARITQLTNKTNQFNLTTRRYNQAEIEEIAGHPDYIAIYGKLTDKFGDNGLVSVVVGRQQEDILHIDLWLMSCRVLKRDMEFAMLDALTERARDRRIRSIIGYYLPTSKNAMVADHYDRLGFERIVLADGRSAWQLNLTSDLTAKNTHIRIMEASRV